MGLTDLITAIGDENVSVQFLSKSVVGSKDKKRDTEVTFATNEINTNDVFKGLAEKEAIIVWVDRSDLEATIEALS